MSPLQVPSHRGWKQTSVFLVGSWLWHLLQGTMFPPESEAESLGNAEAEALAYLYSYHVNVLIHTAKRFRIILKYLSQQFQFSSTFSWVSFFTEKPWEKRPCWGRKLFPKPCCFYVCVVTHSVSRNQRCLS